MRSHVCSCPSGSRTRSQRSPVVPRHAAFKFRSGARNRPMADRSRKLKEQVIVRTGGQKSPDVWPPVFCHDHDADKIFGSEDLIEQELGLNVYVIVTNLKERRCP